MKVLALFDKSGNVHALFRPSAEPGSPTLSFRSGPDHKAETLEVPSELQNLTPSRLFAAVRVDLGSGTPRMVAR